MGVGLGFVEVDGLGVGVDGGWNTGIGTDTPPVAGTPLPRGLMMNRCSPGKMYPS